MALFNKTALLAELKTSAETATDSAIFASLIAALDNLTSDRAVTLETENDLPLAYNTGNGTVFYINSINVLLVAIGGKWFGIDGRLFRDDLFAQFAFGWGNNITGRIGDNTTVSKSSPVLVVGGITNWSQISAGDQHTLAITDTGIAYAWGINTYGRLGDGTVVSKISPVTVVGGITNWTQIKASFAQHSLGIAGNVVYAWGRNNQGELGTGNVVSTSSPVTVVGGITGWTQISGGEAHSLGIANGVAYGWGRALNGQVGDGSNTNRSSPVKVAGGITNWSQISAGGNFSLGVSKGIAYAWGNNVSGTLGINNTNATNSPVTVVGGIKNWKQVSAGGFHSLGLTDTGIAYAWGNNGLGRLGDGTIIAKSSPVKVVGGITDWAQLIAGDGDGCFGITGTGIAYAWGSATYGKLGTNNAVNRSSPVTIVGAINTWVQISAGTGHTSGIALD